MIQFWRNKSSSAFKHLLSAFEADCIRIEGWNQFLESFRSMAAPFKIHDHKLDLNESIKLEHYFSKEQYCERYMGSVL